jgi:hypothetical protein
MKYGDIKIEALKLMFINMGDDITVDKLDTYAQDDTYSGYLVNMPGSVNRCFSVLESRGVLPPESKTLTASDGVASGAFIRFNLPSLIENFYDIDRVVSETSDGEYCGDCDYQTEGDTLVLERYDDEDITYTVLYRPTIPRVESLTDDDWVIPVPENIAALIPYFVKGDLYRDDEPNEASEARNWFEAGIEEILLRKTNKVSRVKTIYSQTE